MSGPIVVGTDGSETATIALDQAIALAKVSGQSLHIVTASRPVHVDMRDVPAEFADSWRSSSSADAILHEALLRSHAEGVEAVTHSIEGDPAEAIITVAEGAGAEVIVVGSKGIRSNRRFILGNTPSKVVHHSPCSTFVVHTS